MLEKPTANYRNGQKLDNWEKHSHFMQKILYVHQYISKRLKFASIFVWFYPRPICSLVAMLKNLANSDVFCIQTNVAICRFQNKYNKLAIALRAVQFWSQWNLTCDCKRFCDHMLDFRPNCTALSTTTIIN